jgi:hypothetical protein
MEDAGCQAVLWQYRAVVCTDGRTWQSFLCLPKTKRAERVRGDNEMRAENTGGMVVVW